MFGRAQHKAVALVAALMAAAMVLAGCGGGGGSSDKKTKVSMFIFAGSHQEDVPREIVKQYEADHPDVKIDFVVGNNTLYSKMLAAKRATPDDNFIDFGLFNAQTVAQGVTDEMWEPIDMSAVPNAANVIEKFKLPGDIAMPYQAALIGLVYNKEKVKNPPTSWSAKWDDPAFLNKVSFFDHDWVPLVLAARLNGGDEKNIQPGFDIWKKHADQIQALVSSNDQLLSLLTSGQATLSPWYAAIYRDWAQQGAPVSLAIPDEGAVAFPVYITMVTNMTPAQKKVALDIINLMMAPDNIGKYGKITFSAPLTKDATLSAEQQADPTVNLDAVNNAIQLDWAEIGRQNATWEKTWDTEVKPNLK